MLYSWGFHYDDVDPEIVRLDLEDFPARHGNLPLWGSATRPGAVAASSLTPGVVAPEAAAVSVPVLVAMGERDVIADPKGEPRAYLSSNSVDVFVCQRMGHMHNFAGTRELFWQRIESWAEWVAIAAGSAAADRRQTAAASLPVPDHVDPIGFAEHRAGGSCRARVGIEAKTGQGRRGHESGLRLESRQMHARAGVRPMRERHVLSGIGSPEIEAVRLGEHSRISIRRGDGENDEVSTLDRGSCDHDVAGREAVDAHHRRLEP